MNLYIPHGELDIFLEKFKENGAINDIFLSEERLEKVRIAITLNEEKTINEILSTMPNGGMLVDKTEKPSKEYILCVGEVGKEKFNLIEKNEHSILTIKENKIRFNSWIKISELNYYFQTGELENFTTMNGDIKENSLIKITAQDEKMSEILMQLEKMNKKPIIKNKNIYTEIMLQELAYFYEVTEESILKFEII